MNCASSVETVVVYGAMCSSCAALADAAASSDTTTESARLRLIDKETPSIVGLRATLRKVDRDSGDSPWRSLNTARRRSEVERAPGVPAAGRRDLRRAWVFERDAGAELFVSDGHHAPASPKKRSPRTTVARARRARARAGVPADE